MEPRAKSCGENPCNCCPSSPATQPPQHNPLSCNTSSADSGRPLQSSPSPQYPPSLCCDLTCENISGDSDRISMPISCQSSQDVEDSDNRNCVIQSVSGDLHQVSTGMFSEWTQASDDTYSRSLETQRSNYACDRASWQMRRKISDKSLLFYPPSRKNSSAIAKHFRPIFMRKRGSDFAHNIFNKSFASMDKCSTDSRLSSNSLVDRITNAESLTKCRSLKSVYIAESQSHLADLGRPSNTTNDLERTTPSHSPHNDGAIACNKPYTLLSVHSLHRDKELSVDDNPALKSSLKPSAMTKNARYSFAVATSHPETQSLLIPPSIATDGRLCKESEAREETNERNHRSLEVMRSCKRLVPQKDKVRKFRAAGRRKLKRRRREYGRLRDMVPSLKAQPTVSKVTLIEEAVKYIEELHGALIQRFRARGLPPTLAGSGLDQREVGEGNIRDLVVQLLTECNPGCLPPTRLENNRTKLKLQVSRPKVFDRRS